MIFLIKKYHVTVDIADAVSIESDFLFGRALYYTTMAFIYIFYFQFFVLYALFTSV
jgi:hypothetical protein